MMADVRTVKLEEITPDVHNANVGTERGRYMLDHSLRQYGAGRSILVDREGRVIAGNKTLEVAGEIGLEDVIIVQTDGTQLVAVQRTDLDLEDGDAARLLAYADNQASKTGLAWDAAAIELDLSEGLDLSGMFKDFEIDGILGIIEGEDYSDLDRQLDDLEGMQEIDIRIVVAAKFRGQVVEWLANGEAKTSPGMGKGVLRRCGLL
jgi:hypothetical protein